MTYIKWIFATLLLFSFTSCEAQGENKSESLTWNENLETAIKIAKEENKTVFINFTGSDWCKWCIKLNKEVFDQKEFENYATEKLVLVRLDFPKNIKQTEEIVNYNRNLMNKYGVRGFPTVIMLSKSGSQIGTTGYVAGGAAKYVQHLEEIISGKS